MKKLFFICLLFVGISFTSQAQEFGANLGGGIATIGGDDVDNVAGKFGYLIGLTGKFEIADAANVRASLNYQSKGTGYDDSDAAATNITYATLPVLFEYMVSDNVGIQLGPELGILLGVADDDLSNEQEEAFKDSLSDIDLGARLGLDYYTDSNFAVGAHYTLGLTKLEDEGEADVFNRAANVVFSYFFN